MNSYELNNFISLKSLFFELYDNQTLDKFFLHEITGINGYITGGDETVRGGGRKV